jgi:hypothetical protein
MLVRAKEINKLGGLNPLANYTDRATAAWRRRFADRGCRVLITADPYVVLSGFLTGASTISYK